MTGNVKVSVVLPTYNVGSFISRCLESLRRQSFYEFEIVVVDDCGSDSSIAIVDKYAEVDKRIRVVRNPRNMGTYHARRVGVEHAVGEFVVFLDPDDELAKDTIGLI